MEKILNWQSKLKNEFYFFCKGLLYLIAKIPPSLKSFLIGVCYFIFVTIWVVFAFFFPLFFLKKIEEKLDAIEKAGEKSGIDFIAQSIWMFSFVHQLVAFFCILILLLFDGVSVILKNLAEYDMLTIIICLIVAHQALFLIFLVPKKLIEIGKNNAE